jgi:hypothetical protein
MARFRTSRMKVLLGLAVVAILVAAFGVTQFALAAAGGNNGTVKIHEGAGEPSPLTKDQTHVCTFHIHGLFFDAGQTLTFEIRSWPPTGDRSVVLSGTIQTDASGDGRAPVAGAYSLDEGHYRLTVDTGNGRPTNDKHKEFWVECAAATTTTAGETTTTAGETTTTAGQTTTSAGATSTLGETSTSAGETTTTAGQTTTTAGETTSSSAPSSSVGGASSSAPSSSLGLGEVAAKRPALPLTGANALPVLVAGLLLFGIGAATVRAARRR